MVPFDVALKIEARNFTSVLLNPSSSAMIRSLFINKEALEKGANRPKVEDQAVKKLGVIGAGMMGAGIAYVSANAGIEVVLIEQNRQFISCPFSNFYIAGLMNDMSTLTIGYDKLAANHGIKMLFAEATAIDAAAHRLTLSDGSSLAYDGSAIIVTQTARNVERIRNILARYNDVRQVEIEFVHVESAHGSMSAMAVQRAEVELLVRVELVRDHFVLRGLVDL